VPCLDRAYRERLAELAALQPGINLRRRLDVPEVAQLIGALAPEPDRIVAPSVASKAGTATGEFLYDERQGAFVVREKPGQQAIVLLDISRGSEVAQQVPVIVETHKGATITARGRLVVSGGAPAFDRRHCIYFYREPR